MAVQDEVKALEDLGIPTNLKWHKRAGNAVCIIAACYFWYYLGDLGGIQKIDVLTAVIIALLGLYIRLWCLCEFQLMLNLYLFDGVKKDTEKKTEEKTEEEVKG